MADDNLGGETPKEKKKREKAEAKARKAREKQEKERLREKQKQLAADARIAAAGLKKLAPRNDRAGTAAARAASAAEQAMVQNKLADAAARAAAAAGQLKAVATRLGVPPIELKSGKTLRPATPPLTEAASPLASLR